MIFKFIIVIFVKSFGFDFFIPLMVCVFVIESVVYIYGDSAYLLSGDIEVNPGPLKSCPACKATIPIRKKCCDCGYNKRDKRGHSSCCVKDDNVLSNECKKLAMQRKRQLESDEESRYRREGNKIASSKRRALETPEEVDKHRRFDKIMKKKLKIIRD